MLICATAICFDPALRLYDLSQHEPRQPVQWIQHHEAPIGIDPKKIELTRVSQSGSMVAELIRSTVEHIHNLGFLAVNQEDERIIDALVAEQLASVEKKAIARQR